MADESLDAESFDAEMGDGPGGYVDDDIDVDDDDDDEPLVSSSPRLPQSPSLAHLPKSLKRRAEIISPSLLPSHKRPKRYNPHPDDFLLRAAGPADLRDYVVAKFVTRIPDFTTKPHVRLFRDTEGSAKTRKKGVESNRKQELYYKSFSGKQRLKRYEKQGIVTVPDRNRKNWTMEITPQHLLGQQPAPETTPPTDTITPLRNNSVPNPDKRSINPNTDVFAGTFDGKSTSRYAVMVMCPGSKTIDVIPVDEYSWFSFRTTQAQGGDTGEMEARMAKNAKKGQSRISKFQVKYEDAQEQQERSMGDNTRIKNSKEFASFGIRRSRVKRQAEHEVKEEMEYEAEFDNDDVAQVDLETVEKPENNVLDTEQNQKDLMKLIKDEPIRSRPNSPGSESEEDPGRRSPKSSSRSPSPSRPVSGTRSPNRTNKATQPSSRQPTPIGMSPGQTPFGVSPSPRSPRGTTPQRMKIAHLMPPAGSLPKAHHVTAALRYLQTMKQRLPLKETLQCFERKTKEQKSNLTKILKEVAVVTEDPKGSKKFFINLKGGGGPSGLPSGR